jgi:hypothetical protein
VLRYKDQQEKQEELLLLLLHALPLLLLAWGRGEGFRSGRKGRALSLSLSLSLSLPLLYIYNHRGNSRLASSAEHGPSIFISFATQKDDKGQQSNKPWQALLLSQSVHAFMCHPHAVSIDPHQSKVKLGITTSMTEPQSIIIIL